MAKSVNVELQPKDWDIAIVLSFFLVALVDAIGMFVAATNINYFDKIYIWGGLTLANLAGILFYPFFSTEKKDENSISAYGWRCVFLYYIVLAGVFLIYTLSFDWSLGSFNLSFSESSFLFILVAIPMLGSAFVKIMLPHACLFVIIFTFLMKRKAKKLERNHE